MINKNTIKLYGKTPRILFLSNRSAKLLLGYLSQRKDDCDYIFVNHSNNYIMSKLSSRSVERILESASMGISSFVKINPNRIRQSFIAKKFAEGLDRSIVKDKLGYKHYSTPQLNKFSLHSRATHNKPDTNVYRYLEDFKITAKLKMELNLTDAEVQKINRSNFLDERIVTKINLLRESEIIEFVSRVQRKYNGLVLVASRLKEWKLSRDLFAKFRKLHPDKVIIIDKIWYVEETLTNEEMVSNLKFFINNKLTKDNDKI